MAAHKLDAVQTCARLGDEVGHVLGQSGGLDKGTGGAHLDDNALNNQGRRSTIKCWSRHRVLSPGHTPLLSSRPHIP